MYTSRRLHQEPEGVVITVAEGDAIWPNRWSWQAKVTRGETSTMMSGGARSKSRAIARAERAVATLEVQVRA
jgi:hypothetical protein